MLEPYNVRLAQAFNGDFTDPAHPQGYRRVLVTGFGDVEIKGSDEQRFCGGPNDTSTTCANSALTYFAMPRADPRPDSTVGRNL